MSTTNDILPFCPTDTGTNLEDQADYLIDTSRIDGNQPGIASSKLNNKAIRQATFIASQIAQYICNVTGNNVPDDGNTSALLANIGLTFANPTTSQDRVANLALTFSVAASAATIAIKTQAGSDATAFSPILVGMRSATITSGTYNPRTITGSLSITIPSTATLGQTSGNPANIYVYLIDNAGTLELAVSHSFYPENALVTTTTISTGATSATGIYSTTGRTGVPVRCVGYVTQTQATAGTWATTASQIQLLPIQKAIAPTVQKFTSGSGTYVAPPGALYLHIQMVGGGGGGGGGGLGGNGGNGTSGGSTTFGSFLTAGGGFFGQGTSAPGGGGSPTVGGTGVIGIGGVIGQGGGNGSETQPSLGIFQSTPAGGSSPFFGGAGAAGNAGAAGFPGNANTGSGGGGGGCVGTGSGQQFGGSGGAGAYIDVILSASAGSWAATFSYAVGAGGSAGSAGTSGFAGGAGAAGIIVITEYYQ